MAVGMYWQEGLQGIGRQSHKVWCHVVADWWEQGYEVAADWRRIKFEPKKA